MEVVQMCWAGGVGTLGGEVLSHQGDIVVAVEGRALCGMGPRDRPDGTRISFQYQPILFICIDPYVHVSLVPYLSD